MKSLIAGVLTAAILAFGAFTLVRGKEDPTTNATTTGSNVTIESGVQIVEITAKGGYRPETSSIQSGIPTILRFKTSGTFDCASIVRIPSLDITKDLPPSGTTNIALGALQPGTLQGTCGMGMYRFTLNVRG
jgi:plastocyanin domain-containing protein